MKHPKPTEGQRMTIQAVYAYLARHGIPKGMVQQIQIALIYDAVTQGNDLKYDRIYTGIALMLRRTYGFGPERIMKGLREFDSICGSVLETDENGNETANWPDLMERLEDETGIVIHTGEDNRLICEHRRVKQEANE